jgi:integrase
LIVSKIPSTPYLSPSSLTGSEQQALLYASSGIPHDHLVFSLALGTGQRLSEIVGLDVRDVYSTDGRLRSRGRRSVGTPRN